MKLHRLALEASLLALTLAAPARAQHPQLSPEELYERVAPSIWLVENQQGDGKGAIGSAVVVAAGSLVTNCHVVEKAQALYVVHERRRLPALLRYRDPVRDLCQLQAAVDAPPVRIAGTGGLRVGAKVYALGNPRGLELTLSDGLVSALRHDRSGRLEYVQISVPISPGSSGGGLFDAHGRLVGITTSGFKESQNLNFALPAEWIVELPVRATGDAAVARLETEAAPATAPASAPVAIATATAPAASANQDGWLVPLPGRVFEYRLRNRVSGVEARVSLRVDRIESGRVLFNQGERVESLAGEVLALGAPLIGEADAAMPPGGWLPPGAAPGRSWRIRTEAQRPRSDIALQVDAHSLDEVTLQVGERAVRALRVEFRGYTTRGASLEQPPSGRYKAIGWFAGGRLLRFEVRTRGGAGGSAFIVDELLELVQVR